MFRTLILASLFSSPFALAESLQIPIGQQGMDKVQIERPAKGMSKEAVEAKFGEPAEWTDAVGTPPISSWIYKDYKVFFEYNHVVHTVLKPFTVNNDAVTDSE